MTNLIFEYVIGPIMIAGVGYVVWLLKQQKKATKSSEKGIMLLLRRQIINDHKKYCINGEPMRAYAFEDIDEIHDTYKALGGNGLTDKMYQDLKALDIAKGGQ